MCSCNLHLCSVTLGHLKRFIIVFQTSGGDLNSAPMGPITQPTIFFTSPEDNGNNVCFCVCESMRVVARPCQIHFIADVNQRY
jgi:hypothetical protein